MHGTLLGPGIDDLKSLSEVGSSKEIVSEGPPY